MERSFLEEKMGKLFVKEPLDIREGMLYVSDRPGLGIEMDEKHFHYILLIDRDCGSQLCSRSCRRSHGIS